MSTFNKFKHFSTFSTFSAEREADFLKNMLLPAAMLLEVGLQVGRRGKVEAKSKRERERVSESANCSASQAWCRSFSSQWPARKRNRNGVCRSCRTLNWASRTKCRDCKASKRPGTQQVPPSPASLQKGAARQSRRALQLPTQWSWTMSSACPRRRSRRGVEGPESSVFEAGGSEARLFW